MGNPALDLKDVDPRVWRVRAGETTYGPFTLGQMIQFVAEGRLNHESAVSENGGEFLPAGEIRALRSTLQSKFGMPDEAEGDATDTGDAEETAENEAVEAAALTNMVIVLEPAEDKGPLLMALSGLGPFVEAAQGTVVLKTRTRISKVQMALAKAAVPGDRAIIVDAGANRVAWLGMRAGEDTALRALWDQTE